MALDANGNAGFTFEGSGMANLVYGSYTGSAWATTVVESGSDVGSGSSLIYSGTTANIAYRGVNTIGDYTLNYAAGSPDSWAITTVDSAANPRHTSIAMSPDGSPAIAYFDEAGLGAADDRVSYSYKSGGTWHTEVVHGSGALRSGGVGLGFGSTGTPLIGYSADTGAYDPLRFGQRDSGGVWSETTLGGSQHVARYVSLDLDSQGDPYIAYIDTDTNAVYVDWWNGTAWSSDLVAQGDYATAWEDRHYLDMAVDSANNVHLIYYDPVTKQINYRERLAGGTVWSPNRTLATASGDAAWLNLDMGLFDQPVFSYYDTGDSSVYFGQGEGRPIPEPSTVAAFTLGLLALFLWRRSRRPAPTASRFTS
ncbi:MAG TPA: PEP-CTERM sorting domain-containing protein [Armatimonadota bacterium]|jgi:hypothetical protein